MAKQKRLSKPPPPKKNNLPQDSNPTNLVRRDHGVLQVDYRGPLPPPVYLDGYEKALPGCADRIVVMAEGLAKHQQKQEARQIDVYEGEIKRGQWMVFGLAVLCILIAPALYLYINDIYITAVFLSAGVLLLLGRGLGNIIKYLLSSIIHHRIDEAIANTAPSTVPPPEPEKPK